MALYVFLVVVLLLLLLWLLLMLKRQKSSSPFRLLSPVPLLGCALDFKRDPLSFVRSLLNDRITLNMSGLCLSLLSRPDDVLLFYRSRALDSYKALHRFGFADTLGKVNLYEGGGLHAQILRGGGGGNAFFSSSFSSPQKTETLFREHTQSMLREASARGEPLELSSFCRMTVLHSMVLWLMGPSVFRRCPDFCERFLRFQRSHEGAVAAAMVVGRWVAYPLLWRAKKMRENLVDSIVGAVASDHVEGVRLRNPEWDEKQVADVMVGLMTAAAKNASIGAASLVVYCLERNEWRMLLEKGTPEEGRRAALETVRKTALPIGAVRECVEPLVLRDGTVVPPGELVAVSHAGPSHDPELWKDPDEWNPDRFLEKGSEERIVTFGKGVHACPGKEIALRVMWIVAREVLLQTSSIIKMSKLDYSRPSLADRDFCYLSWKK